MSQSLTTPTHIFDRRDITAEKRKLIRELHKLDARQSVRNIAIVAAMYLVAMLGLYFSHGLLLQIPFTILMALAMIRGGFGMHDASHHVLFKNKRVNLLAGMVFGTPIALPVSSYRSLHNMHHAHERTDKDPDNIGAIAKMYHLHISITQWIMLLMGTPGYIVQVAGISLWKGVTKKRWDFLIEYALVALFFVILSQVLTMPEFLKLWLYPFALAMFIMNVRSLSEHEFTTTDSAFTRTRTVVSVPIIRWLMLNGNYHLEHHLYPGVPSYNLPKLHELLEEEMEIAHSSVYEGYWEFIGDLFYRSTTQLVSDARLKTMNTLPRLGHGF